MNKQTMAPNETMQLHEILTIKNTSLTKLFTTIPLISDTELKSILKEEIEISQKHIEELKNLMRKSNIVSLENKGF